MSKLSPPTNAMLTKLRNLDWFSKVGSPLANAVIPRVTSWENAVKSCASRSYRQLMQEASNLLSEKLFQEFPLRYKGQWNKLATLVREQWLPISSAEVVSIQKALHLPKSFVDSVNWDVIFGCMEIEYSDIVPPQFFYKQLEWYLAGHFPCGWEGHLPNGEPVVF